MEQVSTVVLSEGHHSTQQCLYLASEYDVSLKEVRQQRHQLFDSGHPDYLNEFYQQLLHSDCYLAPVYPFYNNKHPKKESLRQVSFILLLVIK